MRRFPIYLIPALIIWLAVSFAACAPPPDTGGVPLVAFSTEAAPETVIEPEGSGELMLIDCQDRICVYRVKVGAGYLSCLLAIHVPFSGATEFDLDCSG